MKKGMLLGLIMGMILMAAGFAIPAFAHGSDDSNNNSSSGEVYLDQPTVTRLAQTLSITPDALIAELESGKTLAQIASGQGIPEETIINTILAPYQSMIQLRVDYGYITQEEANALLIEAEERARILLYQDLSISTENAYDSWWQEMIEYCNDMMGDWGSMMDDSWNGMHGHMGQGMMGNGWGHMMGGWDNMMGNSQNGTNDDSGGDTSDNWIDNITRGLGGMMDGRGGHMGGGMMGGGGWGGMMGW